MVDSKILSNREYSALNAIVQHRDRSWGLLFRATRDGWTAGDFHSRCDGQGATIIVVRVLGGPVVGGFSSIGWISPFPPGQIDTTDDEAAHVFTNLANSARFERFPLTTPNLVRSTNWGPRFGMEELILLLNSSQHKYEAKRQFAHRDWCDTPRSTTINHLTGRLGGTFLAEEIEVFAV